MYFNEKKILNFIYMCIYKVHTKKTNNMHLLSHTVLVYAKSLSTCRSCCCCQHYSPHPYLHHQHKDLNFIPFQLFFACMACTYSVKWTWHQNEKTLQIDESWQIEKCWRNFCPFSLTWMHLYDDEKDLRFIIIFHLMCVCIFFIYMHFS